MTRLTLKKLMGKTISYSFLRAERILLIYVNLQQTIERLVNFFERHQITINSNKTEYICFCKPSKTSTTVEYLGVYLDQNLDFQDEVKNILRKMAISIKTL